MLLSDYYTINKEIFFCNMSHYLVLFLLPYIIIQITRSLQDLCNDKTN